MSLRTCLFTRKVFNTNGEAVGCIRVEFIPTVTGFKRPRVDVGVDKHNLHPLQEDGQKWKDKPIKIDFSSDSDENIDSTSSTEEFQ